MYRLWEDMGRKQTKTSWKEQTQFELSFIDCLVTDAEDWMENLRVYAMRCSGWRSATFVSLQSHVTKLPEA